MNNYCCTGRFTSDPELKTTQDGTSVCTFTLAIDKNYKPKNATQTVDFIDFVAWRNNAEFVGKYFRKGNMVAIVGTLQTRQYTDKNGSKHKVVEVLVDRANFCEKKSSGNDYPVIEDAPDELPF